MSGVKIQEKKRKTGKRKGGKKREKRGKKLMNATAMEMLYNLTLLIKDARPVSSGRDTRL